MYAKPLQMPSQSMSTSGMLKFPLHDVTRAGRWTKSNNEQCSNSDTMYRLPRGLPSVHTPMNLQMFGCLREAMTCASFNNS